MAIENFPQDAELIRHARNALGVLNPSSNSGSKGKPALASNPLSPQKKRM